MASTTEGEWKEHTVSWLEVLIPRGSAVCGSVCHHSCTCTLPRRLSFASTCSKLCISNARQTANDVSSRLVYYIFFSLIFLTGTVFWLHLGMWKSFLSVFGLPWAALTASIPIRLSLSDHLYHVSLTADLTVFPSVCPSVCMPLCKSRPCIMRLERLWRR